MRTINKFSLPSCPYCGAQAGYGETFIAKNRALYKCKVCKKKSEVSLDMFIYKYLWAVQIISIVIFVASALAGGKVSLIGLGVILILFGGFYLLSPCAVVLEFPQIAEKKEKKENLRKKVAQKVKKSEKAVKSETEKESQPHEFTDVFSSDFRESESIISEIEENEWNSEGENPGEEDNNDIYS